MKIEFSRQIFEKFSNIKFHENPSSGSRAFVPCGRTNMTELIVAFCNSANAPKNGKIPGGDNTDHEFAIQRTVLCDIFL